MDGPWLCSLLAECPSGILRDREVLTADCPTSKQLGGSCKYRKPYVTMCSLGDPIFELSDQALNMNGTFDFNPSVSTLCQHNAGGGG